MNNEEGIGAVLILFLFFSWMTNQEVEEVKTDLEVNKESVLIFKREVTSNSFTPGSIPSGTNVKKIEWISNSYFSSYGDIIKENNSIEKSSIYLKRKNYYFFSKYYIQVEDSYKVYLGYSAFNTLWSFDKFINPENAVLKAMNWSFHKNNRRNELNTILKVFKKYLTETLEASNVTFDAQLQLL